MASQGEVPDIDGGGSQPAGPSPHHTCCVNMFARPGLPDKPAPRQTSEQKHADNEEVRQAKQAKKSAVENAHQQISTMQANIVLEQEETVRMEWWCAQSLVSLKRRMGERFQLFLGHH